MNKLHHVIPINELQSILKILSDIPVKYFEGHLNTIPFLQSLPTVEQYLLQKLVQDQAAQKQIEANQAEVNKKAPKSKSKA